MLIPQVNLGNKISIFSKLVIFLCSHLNQNEDYPNQDSINLIMFHCKHKPHSHKQ